MSLATYNTYLGKIDTSQRNECVMGGTSRATGQSMLWSQWQNNNSSPGVAPSTPVVPDNTTAGSLGQWNASTSGLRLARAIITGNLGSPTSVILCDRLSHQGGLSGTAVGATSTNLPTAALTRSTSGIGVMAAIEIYASVGITPQTITCSYTNEAGVAGRTSIALVFGGNGTQEQFLNKFQIMPLQAGDFGVKSVETVTTSGSTGTAGNFGVTLFRPIMTFPGIYDEMQEFDAILGLGANLHLIEQNACLFWLAATSIGTIATQSMDLKFIEDAAP